MIKVTPLGGLGEIGSNMVCWNDGTTGFIIDCGILFPYEEVFEINYLIPAFTHLDKNFYKDIIITHAHEDHIGAIAHVVQWNPEITIHATNYTKHMIMKKLNELKLQSKFKDLDGETFKIGNWKITAVDINHSTPETQCIVIAHPKYSISFCYASDFKINISASDGLPFKPNKVKKLMSTYKLRMGMLDSTNILNPGKTIEEAELIADLDALFEKKGRCFITFFTSNICRLNNIVKLAKKYHRPIVVLGRSVWNTIHVGIESEVAKFEEDDFHEIDDLPNVNDENLLFIVSGCQGDFKSALRRIAYREDPHVKLGQGDRFIFSSKVIPGNEDKIGRIYNKLAAQGAEIITASDKLIHCSGHPGQEDLKIFLEGCDFTHYIPVHGETFFLHRHKAFIQQNYPHLAVQILNNSEELLIQEKEDNHTIEVLPNSQWQDPKLYLNFHVEIERSQISQRRKIANSGLVVLTMTDKRSNWKCTFYGLPLSLEGKRDWLLDQLFEFMQKESKNKNSQEVFEQIRIKCRNLINTQIGTKPVCIVH